jgi:DNA (cytosine-5)-methyltransferase 1
MKGCSLFSGAGIAEAFLGELGVKIVVANELKEARANLYSALYKDTKMVCGDIRDKNVFKRILDESEDIDFLMATPPCQGLSIAGKNRSFNEMTLDERNHLIKKVIEFIQIKKPKYVLIENVPSILKLFLPHKGKLISIQELLTKLFENEYHVEASILDASDYGVPQTRKRAIIKLYKKGLKWDWPSKEKKVTVRGSIGHLPTLEPGEKSNIPWHFARKHTKEHILWMKNTPTGKSAFENEHYFPKKNDGEKIRGYLSTYRRIKWDEPAPTITIRNDTISSQRNVHPGRKRKDGTYTDARVLTPLELMLLSSLPENWNVPEDTPELLLRQCIGEGVPPLMIKKLLWTAVKNEKNN